MQALEGWRGVCGGFECLRDPQAVVKDKTPGKFVQPCWVVLRKCWRIAWLLIGSYYVLSSLVGYKSM
jgi:hypothetical protein